MAKEPSVIFSLMVQCCDCEGLWAVLFTKGKLISFLSSKIIQPPFPVNQPEIYCGFKLNVKQIN